jgi:predicted transcriptional regulator
MTSKAVKLDDETCTRLAALGTVRKRTTHWLMKEAIRQFLDREEKIEEIRRDTMERWARYESTGKTVDHDQVGAWLETWGTDREDECPVP